MTSELETNLLLHERENRCIMISIGVVVPVPTLHMMPSQTGKEEQFVAEKLRFKWLSDQDDISDQDGTVKQK